MVMPAWNANEDYLPGTIVSHDGDDWVNFERTVAIDPTQGWPWMKVPVNQSGGTVTGDLDVNGDLSATSVVVGSSGSPIYTIERLVGLGALDVPSINGGASGTADVTVADMVAADFVIPVIPDAIATSGLVLTGCKCDTGKFTLTFWNVTGSPVNPDPASITFLWIQLGAPA